MDLHLFHLLMKNINLKRHLHVKKCNSFKISDSNTHFQLHISISEKILDLETKFENIRSVSFGIIRIRTFEIIVFN